MDFNDTPDEARFRERLPLGLPRMRQLMMLFGTVPAGAGEGLAKRKYDAGWACIGWAPEFGGRGASAIEEVIWRQEESQYDLPANFFLIGQGMIGPTLMAWASDEDKARFLRRWPAARKSGVSCSRNPRGLRPRRAAHRAERDGDDWVINGQRFGRQVPLLRLRCDRGAHRPYRAEAQGLSYSMST